MQRLPSTTFDGSCSPTKSERVTEAAPGWFTDAITTKPEQGSVAVEGTDIVYLSWGTKGMPGLIVVHGGAAHAEWWSFIAPFFTAHWHAVASTSPAMVNLVGVTSTDIRHGRRGHRCC